MKLISYKHIFLVNSLIVILLFFLISCNSKSYNSKDQVGKIGFLGFFLDMDYSKVKSVMDSLLNISELHYFETSDVLGNKQKNLYCDFSGISPSLYAKVNLRGTTLINERLISIQLTLCNRSNTGDKGFSYNCDQNEIKRLFEVYGEKYGKPTLLGEGEQYDWLSKRISNLYFTGPKGRWVMDKIYFWEKGNYIIYFDFGYPLIQDKPITKSDVPDLRDSTSAPVIYYDFTPAYADELLEKASRIKKEES